MIRGEDVSVTYSFYIQPQFVLAFSARVTLFCWRLTYLYVQPNSSCVILQGMLMEFLHDFLVRPSIVIPGYITDLFGTHHSNFSVSIDHTLCRASLRFNGI